ncbi:Rieske Fe-S protein [Halogeometricum borinquense DSM 11551]|uniref:Rieske Fe-S protein n=1 Tax=Halogeometricum borinquense (strain ATCC 700274 / DSM 11551 / JCM 10706 / KCTC 4070 / PR3) TaxID=469382 RepID=E4NV32_HALBP|nr:Rieske (2Fe-2S) protein [Halogeometricum borinquense]ADQ69021.1 Rieske Fe-S protein [Halogeometricum borinquense DSM 11551]ELY29477.1 Rieske Fe-S protein [Halogeometricum borinquense DSM 11551]
MTLGSGPSDSDTCEDCCSSCPDDGGGFHPSIFSDNRAAVERRDYAKLLATVGGLTAVGSLTAPLAGLTRVFERSYTGPVYSDGIYLVDGEGERVSESALAEGEKMTVFPEPRPGIERAPTLLVRHAKEAYSGGTKLEYTVAGYAAYSKVCTHAGCMVSNEEGETLVCPCHFGKFDPTAGAKVVGGPPPRPLPQLPITLSSEGYLIATGDFEGPVGAGGE